MKKLLILAGALAMIAFVSCKKEYTCTCTTTYADSGMDPVVTTFTFEAKKSDAKAACGDYQISMAGVYTMSCDLD